jgi:XTP/dITP diphosphohydrolase
VLSGVPRGLESIIKAYRLQEKAAGVGFDWENAEDTWLKVEEEIGELKDEVTKAESKERISEEFGDLLFAMINYARKMEINPSHSLEQTNKKFIQRFEYIEQQAESKGISLTDMSLEQMEELWQMAKTASKSK